ncbi:hypothetical protein [Roseivivax sp. CAU 1753]
MHNFVACGLAVAIGLCLPATAMSQAFSADDMQRYNIDAENVPAFLAGFSSASLRTQPRCARAADQYTRGSADPASSEFRYITSVDEIFSEQQLSVGAKVAVKYMGVGGSVDVRYAEIERQSRNFEDGAIYGYFERVSPIRMLSAPRIRLNARGREVHDAAVRAGRMQIFFDACGDELIVGKQRASFVQVIGTLKMASGMNETERSQAVTAALEVATGALDVRAETTVAQDSHLIEAYKRTDINVSVKHTGESGCALPSLQLTDAGDFFSCFRSADFAERSDLHAIYTVRYIDVIDGFGELDGAAMAHDRHDDLNRILNAFQLLEMTLLELKNRDTDQFLQVREDYRNSTAQFVREKGCLTVFTPGCENLLLRFRQHPAATPADARRLADQLIAGGRVCRSDFNSTRTTFPMVSPNGFLGCRRCGPGLFPIFIDGRNGQCGLPIPEEEDSVARYYSDDLVTEAREMRRDASGGLREVTVERRPSHCIGRKEGCFQDRADEICIARGFDKARRWLTTPMKRAYYADNSPCLQSQEDERLTPAQCRTFALLDCACPPSHVAVGRHCSQVNAFNDGVAIGFQARTEPFADGTLDLILRPEGDNAAPVPRIYQGFGISGSD